MRATTIGICLIDLLALKVEAIASTSFPTSTQKVAIIASTLESFIKTSTHFLNRSGVDMTAAVTSTGFEEFP